MALLAGGFLLFALCLALFAINIYGIVTCFKANPGWGIVSILLSPLAFVVGTYKLITGKNLLVKDV